VGFWDVAGKGGKNRSRAKSDRDGKRELHFKNVDEGQEYAQVLKMHGGPWLEAYCFDGVKRMCHICGKMGRKVRIAVGDIVLISLRGFQVRKQHRGMSGSCPVLAVLVLVWREHVGSVAMESGKYWNLQTCFRLVSQFSL